MMKKCKYSELCGGCTYQGIDYSEQLKLKQGKADKLLGKYHKVNPIIGMDNPLHYRNKVQVSFGYDESRHFIYGNYIPKTHQLLQIDECMLCDENAYKIFESLKRLLIKYHVSVYNERTKKGILRHAIIRTSNKGEYMLVMVCSVSRFKSMDNLVKDLIRYNPLINTIVLNVNSKPGSQVLGNRNYTLYGKGYITDSLCGLDFKISASSFYQVNKRQTEVLYNYAIDKAELNDKDTVIDAYCGTGTIGLCASKKVKNVLGIELNKEAVKDAATNKKINNIENIEFIADDAGKYMKYLSDNDKRYSAVIMDPPRSGSDMKFMNSLVKMSPDKVIYISCNPVTLADNLKYLTKFYEIKDIQPVDMFPYTEHIETVVCMTRIK
ncbi:MAG: 23S rRNA (uracil(1939)-C(5))-methyltransferase RlmD [Erysipelotrichaceae bacterium]|nr:23S rRNA (uracil(1939)-C(5))-methyltransferase RlmD [Erysipelotrichaceae bacterium]